VLLVHRASKDQSAHREQLVFKARQDLKVSKVLKVFKVRQELEHRVLLERRASKVHKVFKARQELERRAFKVHRVYKVPLANLVAQHSNMFSTPIQQTQIQRLALLSLTIQHCYLRLRCILITSIV
jgi:hypothetical protein